MKYYFAPMEGITGYIYRNAHHKYFKGIHKYFTPFIVPGQKKEFRTRERNDILPQHNEGMSVVPQILTNQAEDFIHAANSLKELGYDEVNLNLGCPSRTVVSKNRGSGFLAFPDRLDHFLEEVFSQLEMKVSVKTRIGKEKPEEFDVLMDIFNRYPLEELIIHPRLQKDFYKNTPDLDTFGKGMEDSRNPVCYNGDLRSWEDIQKLGMKFSDLQAVMLGRGLLTRPDLVEVPDRENRTDKEKIRAFHDEVYVQYQEVLSGDRNILFKMKEIWSYLVQSFTENETYAKKIRKAERLTVYEETVTALFEEQDII